MQQRRPQLVLAALGVLLDEADDLERAQQAMHGSLRQPHLAGDVHDSQPAGTARQQPQNRRGALDRLNVARHRSLYARLGGTGRNGPTANDPGVSGDYGIALGRRHGYSLAVIDEPSIGI